MIFPDCFSDLSYKRTPMISKNLKYCKEINQIGLLDIHAKLEKIVHGILSMVISQVISPG
jgi:hypothetical protein